MKERPIIFSGPMVRAILDGRKTMTRRVCRVQPKPWLAHYLEGGCQESDWSAVRCVGDTWDTFSTFAATESPSFGRCPYGVPGDRLWVRENIIVCSEGLEYSDGKLLSTLENVDSDAVDLWNRYAHEDGPDVHPTTISCIFMPRWASRVLLEVVAVRVERVQDISTEGCIAEGLSTTLREYDAECDLREQYAALWQNINGKRYPWASNPWCWCVLFRRIT